MNSPDYETQESMADALRPFGWTCTEEFWQRYHSDPWVFNLANAVERLTSRCEVYAAGITAIAVYEGEHGLGYETPKRIAQQTLDRATNKHRSGADG